jgi:hypothetical protein
MYTMLFVQALLNIAVAGMGLRITKRPMIENVAILKSSWLIALTYLGAMFCRCESLVCYVYNMC